MSEVMCRNLKKKKKKKKMQIRKFLVKIWHSKCWCELEKEIKVTKIESLFTYVQLVFVCNFGQNPLIGSGDRI